MELLPPGAVIEDLYEIVAPIGKGGMAVVYAARRRDDGADVALKILAVTGEDRADLERRFFRELLCATRVRHPNVVEVHDFGVARETGAPYIGMELLRGASLHRLVRERGPLDADRAGRLFRGALAGLAAAHAVGVVHRDLKPSNLFVAVDERGDERLVVLDFGIACRARSPETAEWTATTPRYAAPEYILHREVGPRLDVYQVGLVLAEALSGRPVVAGSGAKECFRAHLRGDLELPPEALGSPLAAVILRAISPDPRRRFPDAGAMRDALDAVIGGAPGPSSALLPPFALDVDDGPTQASASSATPASRTSAPSAPPAVTPLRAPVRRQLALVAALALAGVLVALALAEWLLTQRG